MSLRDMLDSIYNECEQTIQAQKDKVKIDVAKAIIEYGEFCENDFQNKVYTYILFLENQERLLKTEEDFQETTRIRRIENEFQADLLIKIHNDLLTYIHNNRAEYTRIMQLWLERSIALLGDTDLLLEINEDDHGIFENMLIDLSIHSTINIDIAIKAGFILRNQNKTSIDLSFPALFYQRQNDLLNLVMPVLKENL